MSRALVEIVRRFSKQRVLIIGEAMLDTYLQGASDRLCREAPVPIVAVREQLDAPGGAANTAVNISALGSEATFLSVIGDDEAGNRLREALKRNGLDDDALILRRDRDTLAKQRVLADSQLLVRFDHGTTVPIEGAVEDSLIDRLEDLFPAHDAIIISDYGYGIFTPRVIATLRSLQKRTPRLLVADAKQLKNYRDVGVTAAKPNYGEAIGLLKLDPEQAPSARSEQIMAYEHELLSITGAQIVAVTLDSDGAVVFEASRPPYRTYAEPEPNSRAAGAGDTFVACLTLALAAGADMPAAAELASAAAGVVVAKDGTTACSQKELISAISGPEKYVTDVEDLDGRLSLYRKQGKRLVFTNGCFDILHRGHVTYLSRAKALGDVLIVGVNDDESVSRLKGPERPINVLEDRAQVLSALSCVDHIIPFSEDTPERLIRHVLPDIFVKGGDYTRETLPEAPLVEELGGSVHILAYLDEFSTTGLIEKIRNGNGNGKAQRGEPNGHITLEGQAA